MTLGFTGNCPVKAWCGPRSSMSFNGDRGPHVFELGLDMLGLSLVHAFLHSGGGAVDQVLGLLQTQCRDLSDHLDESERRIGMIGLSLAKLTTGRAPFRFIKGVSLPWCPEPWGSSARNP